MEPEQKRVTSQRVNRPFTFLHSNFERSEPGMSQDFKVCRYKNGYDAIDFTDVELEFGMVQNFAFTQFSLSKSLMDHLTCFISFLFGLFLIKFKMVATVS